MQELSSEFKRVSIGTAAEDKELGSDVLLVTLAESSVGMSGAVVSDARQLEAKGKDNQGKEYTTATTTDSVVKAKWLRWGSNRITPPDVRRNTRVQIYRFADQDTYYWDDLGLDNDLRRLETIVYGFNNNPDATKGAKDGVAVDPSNMHTFEISTHTKQITLRTCKTQGEPVGYVFQFNLAEAHVVLADDTGNYISLDSTEAIWVLKNSFGTLLTLDKNNIIAKAAELIGLETKLFQVKAETIDVTCDVFTGKASKRFFMDTPSASFTGDVMVGNISTGYSGNSKGMVSKGNMRVEGALNVTNGMTVTGLITCAGINSSAPVNAPNIK